LENLERYVPLVGRSIIHDVTGLLETLADVGVDAFEPILELAIIVGITVNLVDGIEEVIKRGRVGETLNECLRNLLVSRTGGGKAG
jgi:hypothetical protein